MDLLIYFFLFLFGILFGSFLNVLIDRFSTGRSVVNGRSYCENCKKTLSWKELIPLVSFIIQKGRCIHCKARIPSRLFLVELLIGILFPFIYFYGLSNNLPLYSTFFAGIVIYSFVGIFFADFEYGLIPDKFLVISLMGTICYLIFGNANFINYFLSGFGAFAFFLTLFIITKGRGMGFGDVKLSFVLGLFLGFPMIVISLYLAFLTGALISIILVIWKKVSFSKGTIPFGPFLIFSSLITFFYGQSHIIRYFTFLGF